MRSRKLGLSLTLLFTLSAAPACASLRLPSARGHPSIPDSALASLHSPAHESTSAAARIEKRQEVFISPTFVGSAFWGSYWPGPTPWGWYGYGPVVYVPVAGSTPPAAPTAVARLGLHVTPRKADILMDGNDLGQARDFDPDFRPLWLTPGNHVLELRYPGYQTLRIEVEVTKGQVSNLHYKLRAGSGIDERSSKAAVPTTPTAAGRTS
jgi:hypothetical protein